MYIIEKNLNVSVLKERLIKQPSSSSKKAESLLHWQNYFQIRPENFLRLQCLEWGGRKYLRLQRTLLFLVDSRSRMSAEDVLHGAQRWRGHCDSVLEMGLDNGKGGAKGVELEDWLLRKAISIKKLPPKYLLSTASVI